MRKANAICLPCDLRSDLDWKKQLEDAEKTTEKLLWELDFCFQNIELPFDETLMLESMSQAVLHFCDAVLPSFEKRTSGVSFYRGPLDVADGFRWSERLLQQFSEGGSDSTRSRRLFCLDRYAEVFRLLASHLPDEIPARLSFDATGIPCAEAIELLSKERFEHFELFIDNMQTAIGWADCQGIVQGHETLGICMPSDRSCTRSLLDRFEFAIDRLKKAGSPFRVVHETFLAEQWDGLDRIVVFSDALSSQGKRKLMGFAAAGGIVVSEGEAVGICEEISLGEFLREIRGRGI